MRNQQIRSPYWHPTTTRAPSTRATKQLTANKDAETYLRSDAYHLNNLTRYPAGIFLTIGQMVCALPSPVTGLHLHTYAGKTLPLDTELPPLGATLRYDGGAFILTPRGWVDTQVLERHTQRLIQEADDREARNSRARILTAEKSAARELFRLAAIARIVA